MKKLKFFFVIIFIVCMMITINFYIFSKPQYPCLSYPHANLEAACEKICNPDSFCGFYFLLYPGYCTFPYECGQGKCHMTVKFYCEDGSRAYKNYKQWSGSCYKPCPW